MIQRRPMWSCSPDDPASTRVGPARRALATALLATLLVGCGRNAEFEYPNTNLGGTVTLDGVPVGRGLITFQSLEGTNGRGVRTPIIRGRYISDKVPLGRVLVNIGAFQETGRTIHREGRSFPETIDLVPPRYRNGFELQVGPDTSEVDFRMTREDAAPRPTSPASTSPGGQGGTHPSG